MVVIIHPAGCAVVTDIVHKGGWGWFRSLFFMLLLVFVLYMAVGIAYPVAFLDVSGFEAIRNLDIWRALPSKLQMFVRYIISKCMTIYYLYTESSYMNV